MLTRDTDMAIPSVCPSVRVSVTFQYCMKTVQRIIIVSLAYSSSIILVLLVVPLLNAFTKFDAVTSPDMVGGVEYRCDTYIS